MKTKIVGTHYRTSIEKQVYNSLTLYAPLMLEREPDNEYDSNAIKVIAPIYNEAKVIENIAHIGYVPKDSNTELAAMLDEGSKFEVTYQGKGQITIVEIE